MSGVVLSAVGLSSLDLHEGISDVKIPSAENVATGCERWPERLRLVNSGSGALVRGRCRATNLCKYCQALYVVETVEMLTLDALEHAPTAWCVLTSRDHLTKRETYSHLQQIRRAVRVAWPTAEYFCQTEFQRRGALHLNLLWKNVGEAECAGWSAWSRGGALPSCGSCVRCLVAGRWCERVSGAEPQGQWAGEVADGVGVVRYISKMLAHGLKAEQAPPIGWKGHRTSQTRGYLVRPASKMRVEARKSLRVKRELYKARRDLGLEGGPLVELAVADAMARHERNEWELVQLVPKVTGEVMLRTLQNRPPRRFMHPEARPDAAIIDPEVLDDWRQGLTGVRVNR